MPDTKHFDPDAVLDKVVELFWRRGATTTTGVQGIVTATGLSRSSLYTTFGGKPDQYPTALRRYVENRSQPLFDRLADDDRGLPALVAFFDALIRARCSGPHARWGCMVSNAHAGENDDPGVREILDEHQARLRAALRAALRNAQTRGQVPSQLDLDAAADHMAPARLRRQPAFPRGRRHHRAADHRGRSAGITGDDSALGDRIGGN
jgi:TetR/AcrR family transcriptional regulator, transcriptional repressor for nem operon